MLRITELIYGDCVATESVSLPFDLRQKSRLRTNLDSGVDAAFLLPPGSNMRGGTCLRAEDGRVIKIYAAAEHLVTASTTDTLLWARACYHLGNRHVPLQIGEGWVRFAFDHVLKNLVEEMGLRVKEEHVPFEPENGAYTTHASHHAHPHPADANDAF
ncbi:MAG: urease accessory protein UreE [Gammaproteobacteria bacterium]|nr:urease accessory protein UreE [Gammaproteobacteria bacterium]